MGLGEGTGTGGGTPFPSQNCQKLSLFELDKLNLVKRCIEISEKVGKKTSLFAFSSFCCSDFADLFSPRTKFSWRRIMVELPYTQVAQ